MDIPVFHDDQRGTAIAAVAAAVARAAIETGVARIMVDPEEVRNNGIARIKNAN